MKIENKSKGRIFKSPFLEFFTKTNPYLTLAFYIPLLFLLLLLSKYYFNSKPSTIVWVFFAGLFSWTFLEYLIHRFLFHLSGNSAITKKICFMLHGIHHQFPRDTNRLFMPPLPGFVIVMALLFLFYIFLSEHAFPFVSGLINGYLFYSFLHFSMHTKKPPKFLKKLWKHHALHHYKNETAGYGVSTTFWDRLFLTMPNEQEFSISKVEVEKKEIMQVKSDVG